ncbi:MAG TPA: dTDP-4-dehydrorhamnose 3,5-epimerase [Bryobacteraceae bacterium]|nr:dTDP-4-dehydrorhamnose 3,5-epimerase [Bryobacteraceae bacterium]
MPFIFTPLTIPGAILIEPRVFPDGRGFFLESYKRSDFAAHGIPDFFVQENHSVSRQHILRGLHFQRPPHGQGKLIRVIAGEIFDVGVDLRKGSATFGKWVGVNLSADNHRMLYLPPWCGHGFLVLSETAQVVYKTTAEYNKEAEDGVAWNDPDIGIEWNCSEPTLSERDEKWGRLADLKPVENDGGSQSGPVEGGFKCSATA